MQRDRGMRVLWLRPRKRKTVNMDATDASKREGKKFSPMLENKSEEDVGESTSEEMLGDSSEEAANEVPQRKKEGGVGGADLKRELEMNLQEELSKRLSQNLQRGVVGRVQGAGDFVGTGQEMIFEGIGLEGEVDQEDGGKREVSKGGSPRRIKVE